jgi:hypothetical protein
MARFLARRKYLVNRGLQLGLLKAHLILFSASIGFLAVGMFAPLVTELNQTADESSDSLSAANAMLYMHEHLWVLMGFTTLFLCLGLLRLSHKIAGPLYRFRIALTALAHGKTPRQIRLRRGDYLIAEAEQLNRLLKDISNRSESVRKAGADLGVLESQLRADPGLYAAHQEQLLEELSRLRISLESASGWSDNG